MIPLHDDNPLRRVPFVTVAIIIINLVVFLGLLSLGGNFPFLTENHQTRVAFVTYGFVPRTFTELSTGKPVKIDLYPEQDEKAQIPNRFLVMQPSAPRVVSTFFSSMFMHAGWMHLLGNMLFLWVFGNNIEDRLGHVLFTLFYLLGGVVAMLCHWAMSDPPHDLFCAVGASGAVAVMLGAYAVTYPRAKVLVLILLCLIPIFVRLPAMVVLGFWVMNEMLSAWLEGHGLVTGVAIWAHLGGFFTGALVMPILAAGTPEPTENWEKEAKEQFETAGIEPAVRPAASASAADPRGNWWDQIPPRRDMPVSRNDPWWEDMRR